MSTPQPERLPLSHEQESLWYREVFTDQPGLTNVPAALRVRGPLDVPALRAACADLARRHPALRTVFDAVGGVPRQRVDDDARCDFAVAAARDDAEVRAAGRAELLLPFDLRTGPPVRFRLYRIADDQHVLVLIAHHLVIDAASVGIALTDLGELYTARVTGRGPRLAPLPVTYAEAAAQQRADADPDRLAELTAYWTDRLDGAPHHVDLVTDRPRPRRRRALGGVARDRLAPETERAVRDFAARARASDFIVLLAAFRVLLWRWTGQRDALVGAPISGRAQPGTEDVVGFFINMLVLRAPLEGRMTFRQAVAAERDAVLGAFDHQDMPYSRLVAALQHSRDPASSPLVQVTFSYRPDDAPPPVLPGLDVTDFDLEGTSLQFDFVIELLKDAEGIEILCGYNEDILAADSVAATLARLPVLLAAAVADPDRPLADIPWLTRADHDAVRRAAATDLPGTDEADGIVPAFRRWAARTPDAVAVRHGEQTRTYAELDGESDALAARLPRAAAADEPVVGVLLDDRGALPATLLALAKAGRALLPLDPAHPPERHAYTLKDARATALITDRPDLTYPGVEIVAPTPDGPSSTPDGPAGAPAPRPDPDPDSLAYVLYTSGSTGRPKGAGITHRALANCLRDARDRLGIGPGTRMGSASTVAFDIGVLELLLPLGAGAELVLSEAHRRGDGAALAAFLAEQRPDVFFATPALWEMLLLAGWRGDTTLTALTGGDVLAPALAGRLRPLVGALWQLYGPTETTVYSTSDPVPPGPGPAVLPVGRPVRNTTAYVLDASLRPVPPGVVGELCLGGAGLARGYTGRPALTADRFVPSPFGPDGARLYRTGDRARLLPDGRIELRGRDDDQVKINGHRIELTEIEAVLGDHDGVGAAAAVVLGAESARRVVACVAAAPDRDAAGLTAALRAHAERRLPVTMLPAAYVVLDELPVTANGKVDRAALADRAARHGGADARRTGAPPTTPHERLVAGIWATALDAPDLTVDDDFFRLGGNSLLAAQVMSRLEQARGVRVPMSTLLEVPTVGGFAERLRRAEEAATAAGSTRTPDAGPRDATPPRDPGAAMTWLRRGSRTPVLALAHPVGGAALCYRELVAALDGDWQVCAFESADTEGRSVPEAAAAYVRELRARTDGPVVYAGWSLGGLLAYEMAAQDQRAGGDVTAVLAVDTATPDAFDWDAELSRNAQLRGFVRDVARLAGVRVTPPDELWAAPVDEVFRWLVGAVGFGDVAGMERRFRITDAALRAARAYAPRPADVELHFVEADEETPKSEEWLELADTVTVTTLPGDHYQAITGPNAARLAKLLLTLE
ncbi:amino acid adenylation domain-containing protein [Streptomyces sp. NPDC059063]|uniref:non-ribosomal peptide synthetase n=1 Tax=unclassified Streptomyces TaxID=2593676 RepID=UPI00367FC4A7